MEKQESLEENGSQPVNCNQKHSLVQLHNHCQLPTFPSLNANEERCSMHKEGITLNPTLKTKFAYLTEYYVFHCMKISFLVSSR